MARKISREHIDSYPIRKTLDGWNEEYSSVDEFKQHLTADLLSSEKYGTGGRCIFWISETEYTSGDHEPDSNVFSTSLTEKITHVLRKIASKWWFSEHMLVQFWAEEEVEGRCYLATLHQPFAVVNFLTKGASWLRKKCMQQYYIADDAADEDQLGPPGRVFRNGNPESSPDILLYSTKEFPLRDLVIGCGLKSYLALPIFDVHHNHCVGVLEFIYKKRVKWSPLVDDALQEVGLRSAHKYRIPRENLQSEPQPLREIREMLTLAIKSGPQLHFAQVWLPCDQCVNNSSCMDRKIFIKGGCSLENNSDEFTSEFVAACGFHNIQNGQGIVGLASSSTNNSYFCKSLSEFSISEYPMKHYAQRARFSSCLAICQRNKDNDNDICVFEFFLQPQSRDDASIQSVLHLLLKIMEKKLKSFEISTEQYLGVEFQPLEKHVLALPMKKYKGTFSVLEFKEFFQKVDLSCSQKRGIPNYGWICWSMQGEELSENRGNDILMPPKLNLGTEDIKLLISEILSIQTSNDPFLIQFWAPKMIGKRSFLSTSEHPFALSHLQKGLCWYRKKCIDDGAKEEELGPPGRVFLNGRPESSPDLRLYYRREFPLRDYLVCSGATTYLALPLFGLLDKKCVGLLEFVGLIPSNLNQIYEKLEKYNLRSTHISRPSSPPVRKSPNANMLQNIDAGKKQAVSEIDEMLTLVVQSPQLQTALLWIPCSQCAHNNTEISCMERARFSSTNDWRIDKYIKACEFHQPQITNGVIGKVIESENKLYFCEDLCSSSICERPLAHYAQVARLEICFAVCLKSSYTGSSLYVIEYFLSPHSTKCEYSRTLCFLLSMMKQMLKSFKVASGRQLGEELVLEARELCHEPDGIDSHTYEDVSQNITGFSTANQLTVEKSGVSTSTFKRKSRDFGIKRWPSKMSNIKNPSLFRTNVANKSVENADYQTSTSSGFGLTNLDPVIQFLSSPNQNTMEFANTFQVADVVIEAKFKDDTIKFEFCVSRGLAKLMEEVGKRLKLKIGKFKLKYVDKDDDNDNYGFDLITLTCDKDLDLHMKSIKSLSKTTVKVLVHFISDVNFKEWCERNGISTSFGYDQLKSQFGKSRKEAAKNLGVSISTFKRKCRDFGIKRWPSKMSNIKNPYLFRTNVGNKCVENADYQTSTSSGFGLTTSDSVIEFLSPPIQNTMEFSNTFQVTDVVIEAKFKDDTIKFEFCVSRGLDKLMEEVGKRLKLKIGKFKLKYVDDDDDDYDDYGFDLITLTCDKDLDLHMKRVKSLGKTTVQVFVHMISEYAD